MYRENKYGEKIDVEKGSCASCRFYRFEREDDTNKCTEHGHYYWPDDSCKRWEESSECRGSTGCFLTTCCCEFKGLPDDCKELTKLREFRDTSLLQSETGRALIQHYYRIAPAIVEKIEMHPEKIEILGWMFETIHNIITTIESGETSKAIGEYVSFVYETEQKVSVKEE